MQAFTALCGTKIMAATAILNYAKKILITPILAPPNACQKKLLLQKNLINVVANIFLGKLWALLRGKK